uniref:F-box/FBD/LRR-repeat protein At5g56810 n=1 Tax=Nicotiana tabacum TaxID=4097 RepID=A0A1S4BUP3_TOBAC|nr:PREDICTED: putative F-box/FBD/LRR-repeat protein At5g56810 [Nicotiana tabacum]
METSTRKPKICGSTSKGIDRISSLPDDILHNILSSLFIFDVVQLSLLPKRWKYIWTTMPYLHFDLDRFYSQRINRPCNSEMDLYEAVRTVRLAPISFYKLKILKLYVDVDEDFMQAMILLLKYSPNLEVLKLWSDENGDWIENLQMHDPDEIIVCLESHLKSIELIGFKDDENEIELIRFFLKNARVLEKLTIVWASYADRSEETSTEVLKFS